MLQKARDIDADEIVIDLEDAVARDRKTEALAATLAVLAAGGFRAHRVTVRINAIGSPWAHAELIALAQSTTPPDAVVVPKVENAGDVAFVTRLIRGAQAPAPGDAEAAATQGGRGIAVQALIETATGLANLAAIAAEGLSALIIGYADLGLSLGGTRTLDRWLAVQDAVLIAARTHGLEAIDGPFLGIEDDSGLAASAARAAELGFDSKWAIHPKQLDPIRTAFAPTTAQVDRARAVVGALADAEADGRGAVSLDGEMLDEPVRLAALRVLARAEAVTA